MLRGAACSTSCAVSVVTATLASRFCRGDWVPVTTIVCSCSGSRRSEKSWVARSPAATVTLAESGRKPSMRAVTAAVPAGTRGRVYPPSARVWAPKVVPRTVTCALAMGLPCSSVTFPAIEPVCSWAAMGDGRAMPASTRNANARETNRFINGTLRVSMRSRWLAGYGATTRSAGAARGSSGDGEMERGWCCGSERGQSGDAAGVWPTTRDGDGVPVSHG